MIPLIVFYLHILAASYGFTKRYQEEGFAEGLLAVFFVSLIFFVGWSITSFVLKFVIDQQGFGEFMDRDAVSLALLTICEVLFYYYFLREEGDQRDPTAAGNQTK
jgi:hypothetical protein